MLDISDLTTAIKSAINAAPGLTSVANKVFYGGVPENTAKPFVTLNVISTIQMPTMGNGSAVEIDRVLIQCSVFADGNGALSTANNTVKAIGTLFHRQKLTLANQSSINCERKGARAIVEGRQPASLVYHSSVDIEFWVAS